MEKNCCWRSVLVLQKHKPNAHYTVKMEHPYQGVLHLCWKKTLRRGLYVFWLFFKLGLCLTISFKRSRRELSIDVAEHRSTLKNFQNTYYLRFSLTPKTGIAHPKTGVFFTVYRNRLCTLLSNTNRAKNMPKTKNSR